MTFAQFGMPLRAGDPEPTVDLQELLNEIYEKSGDDLKLDYSVEPVPSLSEAGFAFYRLKQLEPFSDGLMARHWFLKR
ncbi:MAG: DUF4058 family protein [Cyanobacteria bacterium J06638_6]